jgi:hypothetical protein
MFCRTLCAARRAQIARSFAAQKSARSPSEKAAPTAPVLPRASAAAASDETGLSSRVAARSQAIAALTARGGWQPYPATFHTSTSIMRLLEKFAHLKPGEAAASGAHCHL